MCMPSYFRSNSTPQNLEFLVRAYCAIVESTSHDWLVYAAMGLLRNANYFQMSKPGVEEEGEKREEGKAKNFFTFNVG